MRDILTRFAANRVEGVRGLPAAAAPTYRCVCRPRGLLVVEEDPA
jgi:hypothetical protein